MIGRALQIVIGSVAGPTLALGCATTRAPTPPRLLSVVEGPLSLRIELSPSHISLEDEITRALPGVVARLAHHDLVPRSRVLVRVHGDVDAFVRATGQHASHLRAWATYDTVSLLPPDTWRVRTRFALVERLTHELCHTAIYQRLGDEERARALAPPFFFDEGTCSVVAGQGERRMPLEATLARLGAQNPFRDRSMATLHPAIAYAAAHHAMAATAEIAGPQAFARIVDRVRDDAGGDVVSLTSAKLHDRWHSATEQVTGHDVDTIWRRVTEAIGKKADVSQDDMREIAPPSSTGNGR